MANEVVSGVGRNAKRTDRNISSRTTQPIREMNSTKYGEGKALLEIGTLLLVIRLSPTDDNEELRN